MKAAPHLSLPIQPLGLAPSSAGVPRADAGRTAIVVFGGSRAGADPVIAELRRGALPLGISNAASREELEVALRGGVEAVVCAADVTPDSAADALALLQRRCPGVPFIVISPAGDGEHAARLLKSGADESVSPEQLEQLPSVVARVIEHCTLRRERDALARALRSLEKQHALVVDAVADGVLSLDPEGKILSANPAGALMLGWPADEIVGCPAHELIHRGHSEGEDHTAENCPLYATLRSQQIRAAKKETFWRREGTSFPVEYITAPLKDEGAGGLLGAVVTFRDISARIAAQQSLRRSELLFRELSDAMPQIVWAANAVGRSDYFNYQAMLYTARSHDELIESGWSDLVHPDDLGRMRSSWQHAVETGGNYECEYRLKRSDGAYRWHLARALPVRDGNGAIVRWFGTSTDIDDQKAVQETLRRSEENLAIAQHVACTGSYEMPLHGDATDPNLPIAWSNETFRIFGLEPQSEQITLGRFFAFVPEADRPPITAAMERMLASDKQIDVEHRIVLEDGCERIVHERARLIRRADGTPEKVIGTVQDVTERRHAEDLLRQQAEMLNLAHDAIIVRDFETGRVLFWSSGAERLYGWTAAEAVGRPIGNLMPLNSEEHQAALATLTATGEFSGELRNVTKDGREVFLNVRATLVRDPEGRPRSVLSINSDVTEHRRLEQQFLRAQRLESIGTLASGVAHDLNNILAPILMSAPLLREDLPPATTDKIISTIEESAERGAQIVKQVLTFARGVEGERVLLDPRQLVKEMVQIAQETFPKSIRISGRYSDDLWPVEGDRTQLHQVLLNLSVNARDAMPAGGTLVLGVENFTVDEHYASMMPDAKPGPHVLLRAVDTGAGIPRDVIDNIFDPFFTTKEPGKGTGLGLSTVLGIVKSHGGFLSVRSEPGSGTTFQIFLPAAAGAPGENAAAAKKEMLDGNGETILVVDDEPSISMVTKLMLENHNYRVLTANDGPEALALFAQRVDGIDVVITDMMMPFMDGVALIRALRRMSGRVRFIASTGQGDQTRNAELHALGVTASLTKPYDVNKLLGTLRHLLASSNAP